jgi:hypothetical protein
LLAGEELMKTLITILFFSITVNAQALTSLSSGAESSIATELKQEFENAQDPATVEDFANVDSVGIQTCSMYEDNEWVDLGFGSYEVVSQTANYKGRGPRFPDSEGKKTIMRGLVFKDLDESNRTAVVSNPNNISINEKELTLNLHAGIYSRTMFFRKTNPYIYFKIDYGGSNYGGSNPVYGYCWKEKSE